MFLVVVVVLLPPLRHHRHHRQVIVAARHRLPVPTHHPVVVVATVIAHHHQHRAAHLRVAAPLPLMMATAIVRPLKHHLRPMAVATDLWMQSAENFSCTVYIRISYYAAMVFLLYTVGTSVKSLVTNF